MRPRDFKRWRKSLGLSQKDAAEQLGLKRRVVQYYEKGERDGKGVDIPKSVRLACYALTEGVSDYHGPRESTARDQANGLDAIGGPANGQGVAASIRAKPHKSGKRPTKSAAKEQDKARKGRRKEGGEPASDES